MNAVARFLKRRSIADVAERRSAALRAVADEGIQLEFVNGGGTGSIESTVAESGVTEITVGSGFFAPQLFDWYDRFKHRPAVGIRDRSRPYSRTGHLHLRWRRVRRVRRGGRRTSSPRRICLRARKLIGQEGAGEVQTPIVYDGPERLRLGNPVFMRYAKAGEMCERFNSLIAIAGGQIIDELPTYRGEGQAFM
jgi:D-serine deaminase-like pyridoxal phosphate-dependent protein